MDQFLLALALCHTVHITRKSSKNDEAAQISELNLDDLEYQASSPDEKALVEASSKYNNRLIHYI